MDSLIFENPNLNNDSSSEQGEQADQQADQQDAIDFSNMIIGLLEDISSDLEGLDLEDLKEVYREAQKTYPNDKNFDVNLWAIGRVNMFVRFKTEGLTEQGSPMGSSEALLNEMTELELETSFSQSKLEYIDATQDWAPSKEDLDLATQYVQKYDLKFTFCNLNELYIEEYKPLELELE
jgi:hypothetical protein